MHSLPVARLLFLNTEGTEYDIYRYAKAGKVLELAALLLVAPEKVFSSSIFEKITNYSCPRGSKTLRQYITSEIASLTALRMRLVHEIGSYALLRTCNDKLAIMRSMLMLLEVFERAGDKITTYVNQQTPQRDDTREAAKKLGWLIQESGFALDYTDLDIYYLNSSKNRDVGEVLHSAVKSKICREKSLDLRLPDCMEPSNLHHCFKKPKGKGKLWSLRWSVRVKQDGEVLNAKKPAQRTFPGLGWQFSIPSKRQPYWVTGSVWAFSTSTKVEATIATTKALVPYEKVPLFKQYAHVALPILRRVVLG
ncbi:hypothetical protein O6P43_008292 [Quillaja saponaria]|uniref:Uncharacterized protein n=1 Tax=Quillaja saponaria TaxID=32244 RepID=A0AAD7M4X2_QUISA|nr:hypothetical protein O6P43_008292 [Quillaja saponaria]